MLPSVMKANFYSLHWNLFYRTVFCGAFEEPGNLKSLRKTNRVIDGLFKKII